MFGKLIKPITALALIGLLTTSHLSSIRAFADTDNDAFSKTSVESTYDAQFYESTLDESGHVTILPDSELLKMTSEERETYAENVELPLGYVDAIGPSEDKMSGDNEETDTLVQSKRNVGSTINSTSNPNADEIRVLWEDVCALISPVPSYGLTGAAHSQLQDYVAETGAAHSQLQDYVAETGAAHSQLQDYDIALTSLPDYQTTGTYPTFYRNTNVPAIRNQGNYGTCWAHAAVGCMEINLIKKGLTDTSIDLSEVQLVYYAYNHNVDDSFGGLEGDRVSYTYDANGGLDFTQKGGNYAYATNALMDWLCLAKESGELAYSAVNLDACLKGLPDTDAYENAYAHLTGYVHLPKYSIDGVKELITEYGACQASYYASESAKFYNVSTKGYYTSEAGYGANHAVILVGWDDNYKASNFVTAPAHDGAWIMRNSWGGSKGDGGYYYLSYYDPTISDVSAYEAELADNHDFIYQYDGSLLTSYSKSMEKSSANVFEAQGSMTYPEVIEAVSYECYSVTPGLEVEVKVYKDLTDRNNPVSGELVAILKTQTPMGDMYSESLKLPEGITVTPGHFYSVVVKTPANAGVLMDIEGTSTDSKNRVVFTQKQNGLIDGCNVSFRQYTGYAWEILTDSSDKPRNYRIKAYTSLTEKTDDIAVAGITGLDAAKKIKTGETAQLMANVTPENATHKSIVWTSTDSGVVSVDSQGKITGVKGGTATIKAQAFADRNVVASCEVTVTEPVKEAAIYRRYTTDIRAGATESDYYYIKYIPATATEAKFDISSSDETILKVKGINDGNIELTALKAGKVTLTISATDGSGVTATREIDVLPKLCDITYTIINGTYSGVPSLPAQYEEGVNLDISKFEAPNPAANHIFSGWFTDEQHKVRFYGIDSSYSGNLHLYAYCCPVGVLQPFKIRSAENVSKGIKLTWDVCVNAKGYEVYRKSGSGDFEKIATISSGSTSSYTDTKVTNGKTYTYKVTATGGEGIDKTLDCAKTKKYMRLSAVTLKSLKNSSAGKLTVTYTKNSKSKGYAIEYSLDKKFTKATTVRVSKAKTISKTISKLKKGKKYYVRVRAYVKSGNTYYYGAYSQTKNLKIKK